MKKLLLLILSFLPLSGFASLQEIPCEEVYSEIFKEGSVFSTYGSNNYLQPTEYCLYNWKVGAPEVTLTGEYIEGNLKSFYIYKNEWKPYGFIKFEKEDWNKQVEKLQIENDNKLREEGRKIMIGQNIANTTYELKKAEEESKRIIEEKLKAQGVKTEVSTGSVQVVKKPLTLKERNALRIKALQEKRKLKK